MWEYWRIIKNFDSQGVDIHIYRKEFMSQAGLWLVTGWGNNLMLMDIRQMSEDKIFLA